MRYLEQTRTARVSARLTHDELHERLWRPLQIEPVDPTVVVDELARDAEGGLIGSAGDRFYAWVIGGTLPGALAADWLTSSWDQNAALHSTAPAAAVVEEICGAWLKELLGLPAESSFALVTGGQMANTTGLAAARHAQLAAAGWDVERRGLFGAPPLRVLASAAQHGVIARGVRFLGLGTDCLVELPVDRLGQVESRGLEEALSTWRGSPLVVALQAGDINTGAFDRYRELIPPAKAAGAWVHVDGAFGLWANVSQRYRPLVDGVAEADSWAVDGHKWLNVPYDCGYAFVRHPAAHAGAMTYRASYLTHAEEARDQMDWNPEWSRRARGFATYAAIRELGRRGLAELVERACSSARDIVSGLGGHPRVEVLAVPIINQGLVRFLAPDTDVASAHDRFTDRVIERVQADGEAFFSGTTWHGMRCMRISVSSWQTDGRSVTRTVAAVHSALDALVASYASD